MLLPQLNIGEQAAEVGERSMKAAVEFVNKEVGGVGHLLLSCCCLRKHRPASRATSLHAQRIPACCRNEGSVRGLSAGAHVACAGPDNACRLGWVCERAATNG